jgi:hypothetical protein
LADQWIAVTRLTEHRDVGVAGATGELARELVADALHQPYLDAHAFGLAMGLAVMKRDFALRLNALQDLAHVGETSIDAVQRQERRRSEAHADKMRAMILGERRGERDARLCGLGAVHVKNDVVKGHPSYFTAILAGDPAALDATITRG